jgi:radical SAM enzyme (TIGR01210 family)
MNEAQRIRALRSAKPTVDPWRPIDVLLEEELLPNGERAPALTVFLAGAECPFTCIFCDLWRYTLDGATPLGAIPRQLEIALGQVEEKSKTHIKLYNASNFFDPRAVPEADDLAILDLLAPFPQAVVECHPRLVGERCQAFSTALPGRLQVAMGLETVHPEATARLNKSSSPKIFAEAAKRLRAWGCGLRTFLLVGAPFIPATEMLTWIERSARFAFEAGTEHLALIPVRSGNGTMEELAMAGDFAPPTLRHLEQAQELCLDLAPAGAAVSADTWDLQTFASCPVCAKARTARIARINLSARHEPLAQCSKCSPCSQSSQNDIDVGQR